MKKVKSGSLSLAASAQMPREEMKIRVMRTASNHAIAAGDLTAVGASLANDFVVIVGNGAMLSRAEYIAAFANDFKDRASVRYERIVDSVDLSSALPIAAEHGHWAGRLPDGHVVFTGTYMAMWRHTKEGWKLRSELFVSLTCADAASCETYRSRYSVAAPQK